MTYKITRYVSRKFYDHQARCWLKYPALVDMLRRGVAFKISCQKTRRDITQEVMLQAVLAELRVRLAYSSTEALTELLSGLPGPHAGIGKS